ncbi:MAG: hypothetical protein OEZ10_10415 [Gammaproteobacteria bacterium]|nr:hypothetical protein [Gammaproteobacteria bacterium]
MQTIDLNRIFGRKNDRAITGIAMMDDSIGLVKAEWKNGTRVVTACDVISVHEDGDSLINMVNRYGLDKSRGSLLLSGKDYSLFVIEAPNVPDSEMVDAVRWRIRDLVDIPEDDAVIDVFDMPYAGVGTRSIYVVVARKSLIQGKITMLEDNRLSAEIVDIPELAIRNLVGAMSDNPDATVVLFLSEKTGLLSIIKGEHVYISRTLDIGYRSLRGDDSVQFGLDQIVLEIQRSMDYYESHFRLGSVRKALVCGMEDADVTLVPYIQSNLGLDVSEVDANEFIASDAGVDLALTRKHAVCALALGAALRRKEAIPS